MMNRIEEEQIDCDVVVCGAMFAKELCDGGQITDVITIVDCSASTCSTVVVQQPKFLKRSRITESMDDITAESSDMLYDSFMDYSDGILVDATVVKCNGSQNEFEESSSNIVMNLLKRRKLNSKCSAMNCDNKSSVLFAFPGVFVDGGKDKVYDCLKINLLKTWVKMSGNHLLLNKRLEMLSESHFLCASHFEKDQFCNEGALRLCDSAVPTIFSCVPLSNDCVDFVFLRLFMFADKICAFRESSNLVCLHDFFQSDTVNVIDQEKTICELTGYSDIAIIEGVPNEFLNCEENLFKNGLNNSFDGNVEQNTIVMENSNSLYIAADELQCHVENVNERAGMPTTEIHELVKKNPSTRRCCVVNCRNDSKTTKFAFPKLKALDHLRKEDVVRFGLWVQRCGEKNVLKYSPFTLCKKFFICADHFDATSFTNLKRNRLAKDAIPTLFTCAQLLDSDVEIFLGDLLKTSESVNPIINEDDIIFSQFNEKMDLLDWFTCEGCKEKHLTSVKKCVHGDKCENFQHTNNMEPDEIPKELKDLSFIEERLIARVHPVVSVFKLKGLQYGYSGNIINFSQDVSQFAKELPCSIKDVAAVISVKFDNKISDPKFFKVRAKKVHDALVWLKANNKFYSDIEINQENIDCLPENGNVFKNIQELKSNDNCESSVVDSNDEFEDSSVYEDHNDLGSEYSSCVQDDINDSEDDVCYSGVPFVRVQNATNQVMDNILNWPEMNPNPIDEFKTPGYIACAFPTLFPKGAADLRDGRDKKIDAADYFKHLLNFHDRRFAQHTTFRFFALNSYMRWTACTNGSLFIKNHREYENLTVSDLKGMVAANPNILKKILYQNSNIRGSKPFWAARCNELRDMVESLGLPTFFLTLSCADHHWPELFTILSGDKNVCDLSEKQRRDLIQNNPYIVDTFFHEKLDAYIDKVLKPKFNLKDMWYRIEYQHRGSPHMHGVFWANGAPDVSQLSNADDCELQVIAEYFSNIISAVNPDPNIVSSEIHPCRQTYSETNNDPNQDLAQLLVKVQRHKCSSEYCERVNKRNKQKQCRFKFPFQIEEKSVLREDENGNIQFYPARNDMYLNKYNEFILRTWRANMDISPVLSKSALLQYLSKYISKCESKSKALAELLNDVLMNFDDDDDLLKPLRRLYIKTCSDRDYSAQEVCHLLSGRYLFSAGGRKFIFINFLINNDWRPLQFANGRKPGLSAMEKYKRRPEHLSDVSLYDVCCKYDLNSWGKKNVQNIVRLMPKLRLGIDEAANEAYYRQQCILHIPWREELISLGDNETWKDLWLNKNHGQVNELEIHFNDEELIEEFEEPEINVDRGNLEELMIAAGLGPGQIEPEVDLGLRLIDLSYDWSAGRRSFEVIASVNELKNFISNARKEHVQGEIVIEDFDMNKYQLSAEQLQVIDQVNAQISIIKSGLKPNYSKVPMKTIIQGKAGTGKSLIIKYMTNKIRTELGYEALLLLGPTGVSALNIKGQTIHSGLSISTRTVNQNELTGENAFKFCERMEKVHFMVIDEYSMIGCIMLEKINQRCCQGKGVPDTFGSLFICLMGDIRQLPPVNDTAFFKSPYPNDVMGHKGKILIHSFDKCFFLSKCFRQEDESFVNILDRLSIGMSTKEDYHILSQHFKNDNDEMFKNAMHFFATKKAVADYNKKHMKSFRDIHGQDIPVAKICARHSCKGAAKGTIDDAEGLEPVLYLSLKCSIMLRKNFWTDYGLVNGALGEIVEIIYKENEGPPDCMPEVLMCKFYNYSGTGIGSLNLVPIPYVTVSWKKNGNCYTRQQFPISVAYSSTIAKSQGLTLEKAYVDIQEREFQLGTSYVGMSRVKSLKGLALKAFNYERISNLKKFKDMKLRNEFESFLKSLQ